MKPEHEWVIEAMANGLYRWGTGAPPSEFKRLRKSVRGRYMNMAQAALRAAAEEGFVLAKLPRRATADLMTFTPATARTHNACLDAIETIELEESK